MSPSSYTVMVVPAGPGKEAGRARWSVVGDVDNGRADAPSQPLGTEFGEAVGQAVAVLLGVVLAHVDRDRSGCCRRSIAVGSGCRFLGGAALLAHDEISLAEVGQARAKVTGQLALPRQCVRGDVESNGAAIGGDDVDLPPATGAVEDDPGLGDDGLPEVVSVEGLGLIGRWLLAGRQRLVPVQEALLALHFGGLLGHLLYLPLVCCGPAFGRGRAACARKFLARRAAGRGRLPGRPAAPTAALAPLAGPGPDHHAHRVVALGRAVLAEQDQPGAEVADA